MLSDYSYETATEADDSDLDEELVDALDEEFGSAGGLMTAADLAEVLAPFFEELDTEEIDELACEFASENDLPAVEGAWVFDRAAATLFVIALREDDEEDETDE